VLRSVREPRSAGNIGPISLTAGNRYYIEAIWKEGGGGDYCDVAWRKVGDPAPAISLPFIPARLLETYAPPQLSRRQPWPYPTLQWQHRNPASRSDSLSRLLLCPRKRSLKSNFSSKGG
jgi:hypothetical protein